MSRMIKTVMTVIATVALTSTAQAEVASIAPENFAQYDKDEAYWVAEVSCKQTDGTRTIQRKTDGNEWCGKDLPGFCDTDKDDAANKVCGAEYTSALAAIDDKIKAEKAAAVAQARATKAEQDSAAAQRRQAQQERVRAQNERDRQAAAAPLKKKISIEEQLIKIEQEKLDLRRQELELQRRAVDIQKLLDKNEG